ncbi:hypothetical protein K439DRAFT_1625124 [Ramaria rubella]|nr:hypothetical protein K439DRAFT_1625124 [Ramaria rubella]
MSTTTHEGHTWVTKTRSSNTQNDNANRSPSTLTIDNFTLRQLAHHIVDLSGFYSDDYMINAQPSIRKAVKDLISANFEASKLPSTEDMGYYPEYQEITELWMEMVAYGVFFALLGDWITAMRLCVRLPAHNVLLISEPLYNSLIPPDVHKRRGVELLDLVSQVKEVVSKSLDERNHPWKAHTGVHLLKVAAGLSLSESDFAENKHLFLDEKKAWEELHARLEEWREKHVKDMLQSLKDALRHSQSSPLSPGGGRGAGKQGGG